MNPPSNMPWWTKHAPRELSEMALAPENRVVLEDSVDHGRMGDNLCLAGSTGIGKSSVARILVTHLPCDHQVFQASLDRGIDLIRGDLVRFLGGRPWPGHSFRVAVLEEADGLTPEAGRGLRNAIDAAPPSARVILTMNSQENVHPALLSRCLSLDLSSPPVHDCLRVVRRILQLEGVTEPEGLQTAAMTCTDMRQLLIELERAVRAGTPMRGARGATRPSRPIAISAQAESMPQRARTLRRARRPEREGLIVAELRRATSTEAELRERLAMGGWRVPQPTLYDDLNRLHERGLIDSIGYPARWFAVESPVESS